MRHCCGPHPAVGPASDPIRSLGAVRPVLCLHHPGVPSEQNSQPLPERERNSRWYGTNGYFKIILLEHINSPYNLV